MSLAAHILNSDHPHAPEHVCKKLDLSTRRRIEPYWSVYSVSKEGILFGKQKQQSWLVYVYDVTTKSAALFDVHLMSLHRCTSLLPVQTYPTVKRLVTSVGSLNHADVTFSLRGVKPSNEPTPYVRHWPPIYTEEPQTTAMTAALDARLLATPTTVTEQDIHNPYDLVFALTVQAAGWTTGLVVSRRIPREVITDAFMQDPTTAYDTTKAKVIDGLTRDQRVGIENGGETIIPAPSAECPEPTNVTRIGGLSI